MAISFSVIKDIGVVEFDHPDLKVNVLSAEVLKRLDAIIEEAANRTDLKAVAFLSRKDGIFIAGADIKEIEEIRDPAEGAEKAKAGQDIFNKIEDLSVPTFALIDGVTLGGGCELALACRYRIATFNEKIRIGLPEVNLGILPGFGGTYRLPRLIGLSEALGIILAGKAVDVQKALRIGLVDKLYPQKGFIQSAYQFINEVCEKPLPPNASRSSKKGMMKFLDENRLGQKVIFQQSEKNVLQQTKGFYPAPLKALNVIKRNLYLQRDEALQVERDGFGQLVITDVCKNLIHVFYISEKYKKLRPEGIDAAVQGKKVRKCAVVGAGVMGGGIAQLLSSRGIWTRLKDIQFEALGHGLKAAYDVYAKAVKRRKLTQAQAQSGMGRITTTLDYSGFQSADFIIEAVIENMAVKKNVFKEIQQSVSKGAILATNTSALSVTEMAKMTDDPASVIGFHFFNPVHRMPLIEIITTTFTSPETLVTTLDLAKKLGKTPIVVKDSSGFLVNRILLGYIAEAGHILEETGAMEAIDKAAEKFGMPMGPFVLSDEVGLDVGIKVLHILEENLGERFKPASIFEKVYEKKLLGKKSGKGFYVHGKKRSVNPDIEELILNSKDKQPFLEKECQERIIFTMINEAAKCLEESIVPEPAAVDIGMIFGTGFPPFRGGLLKYADHIGIAYLNERLEYYAKTLSAERFQPANLIRELAQSSRSFYSR